MGTCESALNQMEIRRSNTKISSKHQHSLSVFSALSSNQISLNNIPKIDNPYILPPNITIYDDVTKKYNVYQKEIGSGITAKVFIATNSKKQQFAIKRIIKSKIFDKKRILIEAEISMRLKNQNILNYYEIYEDDYYISYVMENGDMDLFDFIKRCPLGRIPDPVAIDLIYQILNAISYLHENNIIHCDIKPENFVIVFDKNNNPIVKLLDFGNAIYKNKYKIESKNFRGTEFYKAPEIFGNSYFNEKVDEWGVGIIMFMMLTGTEPFKETGNLENNIKFENVNFNKIGNQILREINEKLLCRDPNKRISAKEGMMILRNIKSLGGLRKNENNLKNTKIGFHNFD